MAALKQRLKQIPNVTANPEPDVVIASFTPAGPVLAIRPYTSNDFYWQVYFDTNLAIREVLGDGAFPGANAGVWDSVGWEGSFRLAISYQLSAISFQLFCAARRVRRVGSSPTSWFWPSTG